jgi:ribonuclease HII
MPSFEYEEKLWAKSKIVAGVDEVGRGCLAGPVVSAAVIIDQKSSSLEFIKELNDSKKLSKIKRNELEKLISDNFEFNYSFVDNNKIDEINILQASILSMVESIQKLKSKPDHLLIDGNRFKKYDIEYSLIIKGDSISYSIAAASILAKVRRDNYLIDIMDKEYPEYEFSKHKGYATKRHIELLKKYGPCKYHRLTFLKKIFSNQQKMF